MERLTIRNISDTGIQAFPKLYFLLQRIKSITISKKHEALIPPFFQAREVQVIIKVKESPSLLTLNG